MKSYLIAIVLLFCSLSYANQESHVNKEIRGGWVGIFETATQNIRLFYVFDFDEQGNLVAKHHSPEYGFINIPVSKAECSDNIITVEVELYGSKYRGKYNSNADIIEGSYNPGGAWLPFNLKRADNVTAFDFPRLGEEGTPVTKYSYTAPKKKDDYLPIGNALEEGINVAKLEELTERILEGKYPNQHSLLVMKNGKLVYEEYFNGYTSENVLPIHSITKGIVSSLVGIAKQKGAIKSLEAPVYEYFPEYYELFDSVKQSITITHLLTMTAGFKWDEKSTSYYNPNNSTYQMMRSGDNVKFLFSREMDSAPGEKSTYNSGIPVALGEIVRKSAGKGLMDFAKENLFIPLGIDNYYWTRNSAERVSYLHIPTRSLLKLGMLYVNKGKFNGKQILPEGWLDNSYAGENSCAGPKYWNHWGPEVKFIDGIPVVGYGSGGFGGQFIFAVPELDLIIAMNAGGFVESGDQHEIIEDFIIPAALDDGNMKNSFSPKPAKELKGLEYYPMFNTYLSSLKSCVDYLGADISEAWLTGSLGWAFSLNINSKLYPNCVYRWNQSRVIEFAQSIGIEIEKVSGHRSWKDLSGMQKESYSLVKNSIEKGKPCFGFYMNNIPENYILYGYDDDGYYYKGKECPDGFGPECKENIGENYTGWVEMNSVSKCEPKNRRETVLDVLEFAVDLAYPKEDQTGKEYISGLPGYDAWIAALANGDVDPGGVPYVCASYAELRKNAANYLKEAMEIMNREERVHLAEAIKRYSQVAVILKELSELFPSDAYDWERKNNIRNKEKVDKGIELLKKAKTEEERGLSALKKLLG